jgi:hypothetical protein
MASGTSRDIRPTAAKSMHSESMANAVHQPGFWVSSLSGWISILKRFRSPEPVESRASRYLEDLSGGPGSRRDLAMLQLRRDYDVVADDENANLEVVRAVQVLFTTLADEYPIAKEGVEERLRKAPIAKLFAAILAQAQIDGTTEIAIEYVELRQDIVSVRYLIAGEWQTAMETPHNLFRPLRGFAHFIHDVQLEGLRDRLYQADKMPTDIQIDLTDERAIRIQLIP